MTALRMRVLLLGGTGNLGSRILPALLAYKHIVTAFIRSPDKLESLVSPSLYEQITVFKGDALNSAAVAEALRAHNCDAIMNTAGNRLEPGQQQVLRKIAASVSSAAIEVGKERQGKPSRMWLIGGLSSLEYPGTGGWQLQDFMPSWLITHHRETEEVMKTISTTDLEWTLLCVAFMSPESDDIEALQLPRGNNLLLGKGSPPDWQDHWVRHVPLIGVYLNIFFAIRDYTTTYEEVGDMIAEQLTRKHSQDLVGAFVGMKQREGRGSQHQSSTLQKEPAFWTRLASGMTALPPRGIGIAGRRGQD